MDLKPTRDSLGCNPLNDALHRNPGVVLNGQGPGRHPLSGASYRDPGTIKMSKGRAVATLVVRYIYARV
jgi:hypothetical protein